MTIISAGGAVTGAGGAAGPIDPRDYFNPILYNGNGSTGQTVTGVGFQPDLVLLKNRNIGGGYPTFVYDAVRGAGIALRSDSTAAETNRSAVFSAFTSDGFTFPAGQGNTLENDSAGLYVAWNWKANGAGSSNTDGSITSTVSKSIDSGFSIVTYTGNDTSGATVGHGLGLTPSFIIVKKRTGTDGWGTFHTSLGATKSNELNTTSATATSAIPWNNTTPTSSVVFLNGNNFANSSSFTYMMYVWAEIAGFSKFSSYTGNGSATGPTITTDFQPSFLLIKRSDSTGPWVCYDSARDASNPRDLFLFWNDTSTEGTGKDVDFNSTSFQIKSSNADVNASGGTYIYMCIA